MGERALKVVCFRLFEDAEPRADALCKADKSQPKKSHILRKAMDVGLEVLEAEAGLGVKKAKRR